ncbi:autoinducer synthase [Lentibacter algarum]|uniref:acyl-homoserine-lactone synthase n=1 Tax=Lentibacter algarum TaxID=576131 RepID=UPI001C09D66A|nr:acyl-homoserine-lactone synthase [Lentibacter algarum]MBU2983522.1 autoinducer synthase [Lentibacter algarum]
MIRFLYADELQAYPLLSHTMFCDRAFQFKERLKWDVTVDENGEERDQYDAPSLRPLYVIWERPDGRHGGSMRFLPTTGRTMINEHFSHLLDGQTVSDEHTWECTRFCLAAGSGTDVASTLMLAGSALMKGQGVEHFIAVFDAPMTRVYRMVGSAPKVLGSTGEGRTKTSIGLWTYTAASKAQLLSKAGISADVVNWWYQRKFGRASKAA